MAEAVVPDNHFTGWRLVAVIALAVVALVQIVIGAVDGLPGVRGHFGWYQSDPSDPMLITHLAPGGSAVQAGIRVGDRVDLSRLYPARMRSFDPVLSYRGMPGDRVEVPILRRSTRLIVPVTLGAALAEPLSVDIASDASSFMTAVAVLLAAWLVLRRPSAMTWSLYAFLLGSSGGDTQALNRFGWGVSLADNLVVAVLGSAFVFIVMFAARAPNDFASGWRKWFSIAAISMFFIWLINNAYPIVAWSILGLPQRYVFPPFWIGSALTVLSCLLAAIALAVSYATAHGSDRERLKWIVLGIIFVILPGALFQLIPSISYWFLTNTTLTLIFTAGIAAIAYAIVKGRIVDVKFLVSRAVVAALLAGGIVVAFAIIDWLVSRKLQATQLGTMTEIVFAIALGFWFNALHHNVDACVDRLFFRKRYLAEQKLHLAAHAVLHCTSPHTIREVLVDEPADAFDLASAAIFEPVDDSTWRREREVGWEPNTLTSLTGDDIMLLHIKAEQSTLKTSALRWHPAGLPEGNARPVLAVPVLARRRVVAIVLYGEHRSGADFDADEVRAIERVAEAAGAAYDHVEAETYRGKYEELERRLAHVQ